MILIATPTRDLVHAGYTYDLVNLIKHSSDTYYAVSQGTLLPNQRTTLVKKAIANHFSHILFIDSDMRFPKDTLERLYSHKLPIIGANYTHRQSDETTSNISSKDKTDIETVEQIGFGVTLISLEVFLKTPEPWFATPYDGEQFVGEDVFFCHKAKEAGYEIYVDHALSQEVKHIGAIEKGVIN